jgi:lysophospholipase L1-like esterase
MKQLALRYIKSISISFILLLALFTVHEARAETIYLIGDSMLAESGNHGGAKMIQDLTGIQVVNMAVGGTRSNQWLATLANITPESFAPDSTVIISLGGNDMIQSIPSNDIFNNIDAILTKLDSFGLKTILSVIPQIPGKPYTKAIWQYAPYSSVAPFYYQIGRLHPSTKIVSALSTIASIPGMVSNDGIHLSNAGTTIFNIRLANEYNMMQGKSPITFTIDSIRAYATAMAATTHDIGVICTLLALDCSAI